MTDTPTTPSAKPNCYECKFRGNVPGSTHSSCVHPKADFIGLLFGKNPLKIVSDPWGNSQGWFTWPINFDPRWLEECEGFEKK